MSDPRRFGCRFPSGPFVALARLTEESAVARMIFVNLPVSILPASMAFYEALGFANNPQFTDETARPAWCGARRST